MGGRSPGHGPARASQLRWRLQGRHGPVAWRWRQRKRPGRPLMRPVPGCAACCLGVPRLSPRCIGGCGSVRPSWVALLHALNANRSHSASAMALPRQYGADQGSMAMPSRRHTGPARTAPSTALGKPYGSTGTYAMDAPGIGPDAVHVTGPQPPGREQRAADWRWPARPAPAAAAAGRRHPGRWRTGAGPGHGRRTPARPGSRSPP